MSKMKRSERQGKVRGKVREEDVGRRGVLADLVGELARRRVFR